MGEIRLSANAGADGVLHLDIPVGGAGEYEVVVRPKPPAAPVEPPARTPTPEERGWPPGYFEQTFGSLSPDFDIGSRSGPRPIQPWNDEGGE